MHALNRVFADGFVLVHENGGQDLWSYYCPFVKVTVHRGCVAPAEQTVMGLGVAGAIGAKLARPDADVVCVTGDGAFQMYMKEIPTALQHSAPVLWVVLDNASLHWVKWIARATGERYLAVDFDAQPDLAAVAAASGAHAERIESPEELDDALGRARARAARWAPGGAGVRDRHLGLPRGIRRVPSRRMGPRATGRRERDMSWIETGSTICFKPYTLEEALHGLSEAGFENVEIGAVKGFLEHLDPDRLGPAEIDETRRLLDRFGQRCVSLSGHASLHLDEGMRRLRNVLAAAKALDALVLNTFTGDAETPDEIEQFKANARVLADEAQAAGIRLCIETDSNLLPTAEIGMRLLDEIGHDWIQINYDPGNVVYYVGARPEEDIRNGLGRYGHVHLKDQRGGKGVLDFPVLGEGEIDLASILRDLAGSGFSGPVSMEIEFTDYEYPPWEECVEAARRGKAYWDSLDVS